MGFCEQNTIFLYPKIKVPKQSLIIAILVIVTIIITVIIFMWRGNIQIALRKRANKIRQKRHWCGQLNVPNTN